MIITSIIILSHNRLDELRVNLPLLLSEMPPEIELIVVDNASTDGSREFLRELWNQHPTLKLILHDNNTGVAIGRNSGFRLAVGEYVIALDDDASMSVVDINRVPALFADYKQAGILAFSVLQAQTGKKQNDHGDTATIVANFHGAAHAIRAGLFARVGYLDELCSFGGEEFDFSVRCHAAGYTTVYLPDVHALHNSFLRSGPIGAERREKWVFNYVRVLYKLFPQRMAALFSLRYTFLMLKWSRGLIDLRFVIKIFRAALVGRRHGRRAHAPVPAETVKFYSDPTLFPQYGNVPFNFLKRFSRKVLLKLRGNS
jgi:GT2 family glycosyltransferase